MSFFPIQIVNVMHFVNAKIQSFENAHAPLHRTFVTYQSKTLISHISFLESFDIFINNSK